MGGLGIGWLRGVGGLGGSEEKETVGDLETAKENVLGRRRRRYFLHPCFSSHCGHIIFQIIVFHPAQSATWLLNLTHLDLCICCGLGRGFGSWSWFSFWVLSLQVLGKNER